MFLKIILWVDQWLQFLNRPNEFLFINFIYECPHHHTPTIQLEEVSRRLHYRCFTAFVFSFSESRFHFFQINHHYHRHDCVTREWYSSWVAAFRTVAYGGSSTSAAQNLHKKKKNGGGVGGRKPKERKTKCRALLTRETGRSLPSSAWTRAAFSVHTIVV